MKKILLLLLACITFSQVSWVFASLEKKDIWSYFQKEDGIYYCSDTNNNEYSPCSEFGYNFSSDETTSKTKSLFKIHPFGIHDEKGGWVFFKRMEPNKAFICMNKNGEVTGDCEIKYIKMSNGSYVCSFKARRTEYINCSEVLNYVTLKGEKPESANTFPVKVNKGMGSFTYSGQTISYKNGQETMSKSQDGTCMINGKQVDCAQVAEDAWGFLKMGLWVILVFGVLCLASFVFWLIMLIHACSNNIPNKVLWIVLLVGIGLIGGGLVIAIVYYFVVKRHCVTNYIPPAGTQPYQASVTLGYHEGPIATTQVNPIPPVAPTTTSVSTTISSVVPPPPVTSTTPTQSVESMIANSGAEAISQAPLASPSDITPAISTHQNTSPTQNPPSTNI